MKPENFQRGVEVNRPERVTGDAPSLGKLNRIPKRHAESKNRQHRSAGSKSNNLRAPQTVFTGWLVCGVLLLAGLIAALFWVMQPSGRDNKTAIADAATKNSNSGGKAATGVEPLTAEQALDLTQRALALRDPGKVKELFDLGPSQPQEAIEFLRGMEANDGPIQKSDWISNVDDLGQPIYVVIITSSKDGQRRQRTAALTSNPAGQWRIDFEALARIVRPSWDAIINEGAEKAVVRVFVARDTYYNGAFSNEAEWTCYGIKSPDVETLLFGYCKVGSQQAKALSAIEAKGGQVFPMTLEIRREGGPQSKQFEISQVLARGWVMKSLPYDQGF
jgi:hypothetical protein